MRDAVRLLGFGLIWWALSSVASAHTSDNSYINITIDKTIEITWDIALQDIEFPLGIAVGTDPAVVQSRTRNVMSYALSHIELTAGQRRCRLLSQGMHPEILDRTPYLRLLIRAVCPHGAKNLSLDYWYMFAIDPHHRAIARATSGDHSLTKVLIKNHSAFLMDVSRAGTMHTLAHYFDRGLIHSLRGWDFSVFLVLMLFVLLTYMKRLREVPIRSALRVFGVLAASVVSGHWFGLGLCALEVFPLTSAMVAPATAAILLGLAMTSIPQRVPLWMACSWFFALSLVQSVGFANELRNVGLRSSEILFPGFVFSAGIAVCELVALAMFLPLTFHAATKYERVLRLVQIGASVGLGMISIYWLLQRTNWI